MSNDPSTPAVSKGLSVAAVHDALGALRDAGYGAWIVKVPFTRGQPGLGGRTATPIRRIDAGFDWDKGKVFLEPVQQLGLGDEKLAELGARVERQASQLFHIEQIVQRCVAGGISGAELDALKRQLARSPRRPTVKARKV